MKNRFLNVTAPPAGAPEGLSEWFYSLQATLNDFIMINERSGPANVTVDGNRTSLLNFVDPNGCLTVTPDEQTVTLDFSGLTPIVPVPPACTMCLVPPRTVTIVMSGSTDPACDGTWILPWAGDATNCMWYQPLGPPGQSVTADWGGFWSVWFSGAGPCCPDVANIFPPDCNTGGSGAACGGTVTLTPNP